MCCFSVGTPTGVIARLLAPRVRVSATNIFARMVGVGSQGLAYGMNLSMKEEVAMVLPLPVVPGAGEDAVRFVDLSAHPNMFSDFRKLFEIMLQAKRGGPSLRLSRPKTLVVHDIGSFVASYVPSRADFARLDPRFRMPDVLFEAVPAYRDYGFAVFQLKPGTVTVHPMGLVFPTRDPDRLFFPTVHLHDGRFHAKAKFDHALYYQLARATEVGPAIVAGEPPSGSEIVSWAKPRLSYADLVDTAAPMLRQFLRGKLANADTWIS